MVAGSVLAQETPPGEGQSAGVGESAAGGAVWMVVWVVLAGMAVWGFRRQGWFARASYEGNRDITGLTALGWLAVGAGVFFGQGIGGMMALGFAPPGEKLLGDSLAHCGGAVGAVVTWLVVRSSVLPAEPGGGVRGCRRDIWVGALVAMAAIPLVSIVGIIAQAIGEPTDALSHKTLRMLAENSSVGIFWLTVVAVVVAAPVAEELIFRGLLQTAFRRAGLGVLGATVAASFAFLLVHASVLDGVMMPALFTLSMILGLSFEKTGRLGTPIVAHACFNAFNLWASGV